MTTVTVLKYYSVTSGRDVVELQKKLNELKEKHPDREYMILANMRAGGMKFTAAQVKTITQEWPDPEKDLGIGPLPERPLGPEPWNTFSQNRPDWQRYYDEVNDRRALLNLHLQPLRYALRQKLNTR